MLLIVLLLVTLVLFALFLGGGLVAQGYFYQQPADNLPVRALAGAALVGSFITMWVWLDRGAPRKYDTFFEFAPYETKEFTEFEAVRWVSDDGTKLNADAEGKPVEVVAKFHKAVGGRAGAFAEEGTEAPFQMNSTGKSGQSYMTAAIRAKPAPDADPVRFNAKLKETRGSSVKQYAADRRFVEDRGSRYVEADQLGVVYVPSTGTVVLALLINFLHFLIWFVAFWPILQFTRGHAFGLAVGFGMITMLMVMPLLFKPNRAPKPPAEAPKAALVHHREWGA